MKMKIDNWIERGLSSLSADEIFDGMQLLEGAMQRVFRSNKPKIALRIIKGTNEILIGKGLNEIFCKFILDIIPLFRKKLGDMDWFMLIPDILSILRKQSMSMCTSNFLNRLILESKPVQEDFLESFVSSIAQKQYTKEVVVDLNYYHAGVLVFKKDYVKCFTVLKAWYKLTPSSPQVLTYLTLAELNAYEVEGCGKYLSEAKSLPDKSSYIELSSHIFKSVDLGNYDLYLSMIEEFTDLVNVKKDALLKGLCDGIADFLKPKNSAGLFSLFGG